MSPLEHECLVLNRGWVAIGTKKVQDVLIMMAKGTAKGMDFTDGCCLPVSWKDWLKLPIREEDGVIRTGTCNETGVALSVRVPVVIVLKTYDAVPVKRRRLTMKNVMDYYRHTCAYSGVKLTKGNRTLDHVVPRAQGGTSSWNNLVACQKEINSLKGNRTPEQAGLKLLVRPHEPKQVPFTEILRHRLVENPEEIHDEWKLFIKTR